MNRYVLILILFSAVINVNTANSQNKIYIFYGPYCCVDCFKTVKIYTDALVKEKKVDSIFVIARSMNQVLQRKILKRDISKLMPDYPIIYEFIEEQDPWPPKNLKGGQFGKFNVSITPTLLFVIGDKETFISYETLYKYKFNLEKIIKEKKIGL
ncbi:MAG: hypothetical protein WCR42_08895 [bacterium]